MSPTHQGASPRAVQYAGAKLDVPLAFCKVPPQSGLTALFGLMTRQELPVVRCRLQRRSGQGRQCRLTPRMGELQYALPNDLHSAPEIGAVAVELEEPMITGGSEGELRSPSNVCLTRETDMSEKQMGDSPGYELDEGVRNRRSWSTSPRLRSETQPLSSSSIASTRNTAR